MKEKATHWAVTILVALFFAAGLLLCLLRRPQNVSEAERRPLAQRPAFSLQGILKGSDAAAFETYAVDQFPLRDAFRSIKALLSRYVFLRGDNNGFYQVGGVLVKRDDPLNSASVQSAADKLAAIYDKYLAGGGHRVVYAVVPGKNHYLTPQSGRPALDDAALLAILRDTLDGKMTYADLYPLLDAGDYYTTDTHWRQECLLEPARALAAALVVTLPDANYVNHSFAEFYGVYHGQSALPTPPETLTWLQSAATDAAQVHNAETGGTGPVYDQEKLDSADPYELFLSGSQALLTVENPLNQSGRKLLLFRDSFGSSIAPLLLEGYSEITLVDIRYLSSAFLDRFIDFSQGQDVLFLYSTLVLNNSAALK